MRNPAAAGLQESRSFHFMLLAGGPPVRGAVEPAAPTGSRGTCRARSGFHTRLFPLGKLAVTVLVQSGGAFLGSCHSPFVLYVLSEIQLGPHRAPS